MNIKSLSKKRQQNCADYRGEIVTSNLHEVRTL